MLMMCVVGFGVTHIWGVAMSEGSALTLLCAAILKLFAVSQAVPLNVKPDGATKIGFRALHTSSIQTGERPIEVPNQESYA
jgi:hypothetical protein